MQLCFSHLFIATPSLSQDLGGSAEAGRPTQHKWTHFLPDTSQNSADAGVDPGVDPGVCTGVCTGVEGATLVVCYLRDNCSL